MEEEKAVEIVNLPASSTLEKDVDKKAIELSNAIASTQDLSEMEALNQQFKLNDIKKNAFRKVKLDTLLDTINQEVSDRITKRPGEISNKELLDSMSAIQNQLDRAQKTVDGVNEVHAVQVNNTQNNTVNIHVGNEKIENLSKTSRDKITNLITQILKESGQKEASIIDVEAAEKREKLK